MVSIVVPKRRGPKATLDDRTFIDAVLYRAKTGNPWRDLPERFGSWKTVFNRFSNWSRRGHWAAIFKALQLEADDDGVIIDASIVRAHQDAAGGKGGSSGMHWVVLEVGSQRRSTPSSTRKGARSTSKSRKASNTSRPSPKRSSRTTPAAKRS
jgi:transposase